MVSYLKQFLEKYKPKFYISLHYGFLKQEHISLIVDILFDIYEFGYIFNDDGIKTKIYKDEVLALKKSSIVFE